MRIGLEKILKSDSVMIILSKIDWDGTQSCWFKKGITKISYPLEFPDLQADSSKNDSSILDGNRFWGVEKFSFLAIPGESSSDYSPGVWDCILSFLLIVEFQWFLMELSVLPGRSLAIMAHLLPYLYTLFLTACEPE